MGMELLMARARLNHAAGILPIGATPFYALADGGAQNDVPLPAGSQAGDVVLLAGEFVISNASVTVTPPSGSTTVKATTTYYTLGNSNWFAFAYLYTLTAADITAGTVPLTVTPGSGAVELQMAAFAMRGAAASIDGTVGQLIQTTPQAMPVTMTAPGRTNAADGDLLVQFAAVSTSSVDTTSPYVFTPAAGWTKAIDAYHQSLSPVSLSYMQQGTDGATGDISETFARQDGGSESTAYGVWLFAIKALKPVSGFQIVEKQTGGYTNASGGSITFANDVQDGDFVAVAVSRQANGATTVSDSNGTAYTNEGFSGGVNSTNVNISLSAAQVAASGFTVSVAPGGASVGEFVAYLLRGAASLTVDTANVLKGSTGGGSIAAGATHNIGPYSTSGAAFVVGAIATYQGETDVNPWTFGSSALTADVDVVLSAAGHSALIGHAVTTGAVSNQTFQDVSGSSSAAGNDVWLLIPFLIG